ncbi:MAG: hypothetical protein S4CHLAM6_08620 [Chlamydiae bacterium]|nr:hypothetical protein [Chlamydiota bacterium]
MCIELRRLEAKEVFYKEAVTNYSLYLSSRKTTNTQLSDPRTFQEDLKLRDLCRLFYFISFSEGLCLPPAHLELRQLSPRGSSYRISHIPRIF